MTAYGTPYIEPSLLSPAAVLTFLEGCAAKGVDLHQVVIYRNNRLALRASLPPYDCTDKRELYSMSKSFTSTAIGLCVAEGLLSVEDLVIDYFPDKLPAVVSENLAAMKIRHLLSMNTGHDADTMPFIFSKADSAREFLARPVPFEPGSRFLYDTGATYMLSAILTKVTGQTLYDYLTPRLFAPLGIKGGYWNTTRQKATLGGYGLHISCDDLSKFGLLYFNDGVYDGKRLVPEAWISEATRKHSDNAPYGATPDWQSGYGYQFWVNGRGGYRGDGAFGQVCLIRKDKGIVFAIQTESPDMQRELDLMQDLIDGADGADASVSADDVLAFVGAWDSAPKGDASLPADARGYFLAKKNLFGVTALSFSTAEEETLLLSVSDGTSSPEIRFGRNRWVSNACSLMNFAPYLVFIKSDRAETLRFASCYTVEDGKLLLHIRYLDRPHKHTLTCSFTPSGVEVSFACSVELPFEDKKALSARRA